MGLKCARSIAREHKEILNGKRQGSFRADSRKKNGCLSQILVSSNGLRRMRPLMAKSDQRRCADRDRDGLSVDQPVDSPNPPVVPPNRTKPGVWHWLEEMSNGFLMVCKCLFLIGWQSVWTDAKPAAARSSLPDAGPCSGFGLPGILE